MSQKKQRDADVKFLRQFATDVVGTTWKHAILAAAQGLEDSPMPGAKTSAEPDPLPASKPEFQTTSDGTKGK